MRDAAPPAPKPHSPGAGAPVWTPKHVVTMLSLVDDALKAEHVALDVRHRVAHTLLYGASDPFPPGTRIICPRCGKASHHPEDVRQGYCGACHWWTSDPNLSTPTGRPAVDEHDSEQP